VIGYHYTTLEAFEKIQNDGLFLHPLEERHVVNFLRNEAKYLARVASEGCIWVYTEPMLGEQLVGMLMYVSTRHESHGVVALEVEYSPEISARAVVERGMTPADTLLMRHTLEGAGLFNHVDSDYDLITEPVPPTQITFAGQWNLVDFANAGCLLGASNG